MRDGFFVSALCFSVFCIVYIAAFPDVVLSPNGGTIVETNQSRNKCTLYLATSTIPNAGLGVFTTISLVEGQQIGFGDPAIPVVDLDFHNGGSRDEEDYHWLFSEYVWSAREAGPYMETEAESTSASVPGMGSMPNCHFRLKNLEESHCKYDTAGIKRVDPGIGAFTGYHDRLSHALHNITPGSELFVDYGMKWFLSRESYMGLIPFEENYTTATRFLEKFEQFLNDTTIEIRSGEDRSSAPENFDKHVRLSQLDEFQSDLWDVIINSVHKSRPLSALPKDYLVAKRAAKVGIHQTELEQSIRSIDFLKKHGKCLDNIAPGNSTIPSAGRGAFARRFLPKDSLVAPAPLLHVPDRDVLNIYGDIYDDESETVVRDLSGGPIGHQLLLNYCFGHPSSTLLLCPYGPGTQFINHNSKDPNAKIVWSNDTMYHNKSWFEQPISPHFENEWTAGLALEYVALRDIKIGEEVTIDYGREWEEAWEKHVKNWLPSEGYENYISPQDLNADYLSPLPTFEEDPLLYGEDIDAYCIFSSDMKSNEWSEIDMDGDEFVINRIVERNEVDNDSELFLYTLELTLGPEDEKTVVTKVPRKAISFYYKHYRSDMFVRGAFRHEMMIPDEMFPVAWKNLAR